MNSFGPTQALGAFAIRSVCSIAVSLSLLSATAAFSAPASAADDVVLTKSYATEKGKDGAPFQFECESGSYLSGFEGRAGAWIDHLRIVCSRWDAARGKLEPPVVVDRQVGQSDGGDPTREVCPTGLAVGDRHYDVYAHVEESTWALHSLEFHCVNATDGTRPKWRKFGSTWPANRDTAWGNPIGKTDCPNGYVATGIHGRSAKFIHALGLVCRPAPKVSPVAGTAGNDTARAKAYNGRWAVSGASRVGNDMVVAGGASIDTASTPPPPQAPPMARTTSPTDVYRKNADGTFSRTDEDRSHFLPKDFVAPVLAKEGGWWKLELKTISFAPGGEGWVAADDLEMQ